jgi:hypothetical protein
MSRVFIVLVADVLLELFVRSKHGGLGRGPGLAICSRVVDGDLNLQVS